MKGFSGSHRPKVRRVQMELHHGVRPSVWREIAMRPHLVVAAIGTACLLGLAGTAIWLALPSEPRPAFTRAEAAPAETSSASVVTEALAAEEPDPAPVGTAVQKAAPAAQATAVIVDPPPLDPTNPRWIDDPAEAGQDAAAPESKLAAATEDGDAGAAVNAYAEDDAAEDDAATAAIPVPKPEIAAEPEVEEKPVVEAQAAGGRMVPAIRAVTMRARPSSRGSAIGVVPARADVRVISCSHWCEIVYKGKRGFVYRRFLRNNGR